jgi:hypothetical protein
MIEIEWDTSAYSLYWWCLFFGWKYKKHKETTQALLDVSKEVGLEVNRGNGTRLQDRIII